MCEMVNAQPIEQTSGKLLIEDTREPGLQRRVIPSG
jgi:hypothetical protein